MITDAIFPHKKRKRNNIWLTSLADLLALLLAFFVLVFSMNEVHKDKWMNITELLGQKLNDATTSNEEGLAADKNVELFKEQKAFDLDYLENILKAKITSNEVLKDANIFHSSGRLIISFAGTSYFESGSVTLSENLDQAVRLLGESLRYVKNRVEVYGHSDPSVAAQTSKEDLGNWGLSLSRALSVADGLKRAGYSFPVQAFGMSDSRFFELSGNLSEEERYSLARRVDIVIREAEGRGR
ncbi:OmpA family protein [Sneathiella sp. P13V-1]|uniref:OmpA/MotB family protein n=1 Tax=Sneathiella sp. P13V-1 TaxID=2697366 RepID=UPI00187B909C|nr:flagellar motor protein MotB [Sneathiella sp. P13V-1]MBE7638313.1 OmpA family protein [Sneathiella sp. P13V-1]